MSSTRIYGAPLAGLAERLFGRGDSGEPDALIAGAIAWLRDRIEAAHAEGAPCCRILIAGAPEAPPQSAALAMARGLAAAGERTLAIDISQGAASLSAPLELPRAPGFAELCQQRASFEAVIRRDPASPLHVLPSGRPRAIGGDWGPPGMIDKVCRAIDAAYGAALFCAEHDEALLLAGTLKRPFAAAVLVTAGAGKAKAESAALEALGLPLFRLERRA